VFITFADMGSVRGSDEIYYKHVLIYRNVFMTDKKHKLKTP